MGKQTHDVGRLTWMRKNVVVVVEVAVLEEISFCFPRRRSNCVEACKHHSLGRSVNRFGEISVLK